MRGCKKKDAGTQNVRKERRTDRCESAGWQRPLRTETEGEVKEIRDREGTARCAHKGQTPEKGDRTRPNKRLSVHGCG